MRSTDTRKAAVNASTVFAVTLAIIFGLICAWGVKTFLWRPVKAPEVKVEPTYRVTVLASNVTNDTAIQGIQVKRVTVDRATYDRFKAEEKDRGEMLIGSQPIGRVTTKTLFAERPVYTGDVKTLKYPEPVAKRLEPGKVASIVEVPMRNTMVRENDRVDVLCTLSNTDPELGPTETRTAVMAKNVRVLARFNTTRDAALPSRIDQRLMSWPFTLEVTPYRYALMELAKSVGGAFTLRIHSSQEGGAGVATTVAATGQEESEDKAVDRVTTEDLARLFGFSKPLPPKYFEVEKFTGIDQVPGVHIFLQPGSPPPPSSGSGRPSQPGRGTPGLQGPGIRPGEANPRSNQIRGASPGNRQASVNADMGLTAASWQRASIDSNGRMASADRVGGLARGNSMAGGGSGLTGPATTASLSRASRGLGAPADPSCPTCGRKRQ